MNFTQVTVVIPTKSPVDLDSTLLSLARSPESIDRVIVVDSSYPTVVPSSRANDLLSVTVVPLQSGQLEAECVGIELSASPRTMLLDSDQSVQPGLMNELAAMQQAAVVVPETTSQSGLLSRLVQSNAAYLESAFRLHPSLRIPVVPRFYFTEALKKAVNAVRQAAATKRVWPETHSDSVLFHYWVSENAMSPQRDVAFASRGITHRVPTLPALLAKSYRYGVHRGRFEAAFGQTRTEEDQILVDLIRNIDTQRVYWEPRLGLNFGGIALDLIRGAAYFPGAFRGRHGVHR